MVESNLQTSKSSKSDLYAETNAGVIGNRFFTNFGYFMKPGIIRDYT